jgi:hypothetical protein
MILNEMDRSMKISKNIGKKFIYNNYYNFISHYLKVIGGIYARKSI